MTRKVAEVFPPGEFIQEEMEERGWSQDDLAAIMGTSKGLISQLLNAKRAVTNDTAELLARAFGTSAVVWLNLEYQYRQSLKKKSKPDVELRARLFAKAPVRDMIKRAWLPDTKNAPALLRAVLDFYGRASLDEEFEFEYAARKSGSYKATTPAQWAWLHRARQMARVLTVKNPWRPSRCSDLVHELQRLTMSADAVQEVPRIMAEFGIRFVVVEPLPRAKMDGASFWLPENNQPVIAVSLRYDRIDNFWHTTMHECGHIKHGDRLSVDVDVLSDDADKPEAEKRADDFAVSSLIPPDELEDFCVRVAPLFSAIKIIGFASRLRVHPGIVVGQLHHRKPARRGLDYSYFRGMLEPVRKLVTGTAFTDGWGKAAPL
jgi:HTH-type transcriptional regulator / antitoxin HigA